MRKGGGRASRSAYHRGEDKDTSSVDCEESSLKTTQTGKVLETGKERKERSISGRESHNEKFTGKAMRKRSPL